jgi:hypothetical protein
VAPNERRLLVEAIGVAADAVESIIINGSAVAMNTFNTAKPS